MTKHKIYIINERNSKPFDDLCEACPFSSTCDITQNDCIRVKALYDELYYP